MVKNKMFKIKKLYNNGVEVYAIQMKVGIFLWDYVDYNGHTVENEDKELYTSISRATERMNSFIAREVAEEF